MFLGTGAAEQIPSIYCRCDFCARVRQGGGKDQRTRASLRIGERYQIDFGPDANWQMHRCGIDMFDVEHLFITHTHSDHFQFEEIVSKSHAVKTNGKPLQIYMSVPAKEYLESILFTFDAQIEDEPDLEAFKKRFPVNGLQYFTSYEIGELLVETVKGSHKAEGRDQFSLNYLIRLPDGRRLLYAVDTGYFLEETWAFLKGKRVDLLIMDCTFPGRREDPRSFGHHTLLSYLESLERMKEIGFINARTSIFATHFDPHQALFHEELQVLLRESAFPVTIAYDGLKL
jgi:phosphoribosyl 1,2-cyclic phosphate phosphodiesterase